MPEQDPGKRFMKLDPIMFTKRILTNITFNRLEDLHRYVEEMEWKFDADKKTIEKRYDEEMVRLGDDVHPRMKELIGENYNEDYFIIDEIFARQMRYSVLATIYTILEMALNDLCHQLRRIKELAVEIDDLTGAGIDRAKRYLNKVCLIDFPEQSHEWNEIVKLNKIRSHLKKTEAG